MSTIITREQIHRFQAGDRVHVTETILYRWHTRTEWIDVHPGSEGEPTLGPIVGNEDGSQTSMRYLGLGTVVNETGEQKYRVELD